MSNYQNWKSYTKIIPYTKAEREEQAEADRIDAMNAEEDEANQEILSWTASNGAEIRVRLPHSGRGFDVIVDGKWYESVEMVPAPEKFRAVGIVAKLGPVGLTAERKAILESK